MPQDQMVHVPALETRALARLQLALRQRIGQRRGSLLHLANCDPNLHCLYSGCRWRGRTWISDRVVALNKEGIPLGMARVHVYSEGKLARSTVTDHRVRFLLAHLRVGHFRLVFEGLGAFDVEVVPLHAAQQAFYGFARTNGCLSWGMDTN
jgi:hypothetical protein